MGLQTLEEYAETGLCSYLSKSIICLYTHVPSCTFAQISMLSVWNSILRRKNVAEFPVGADCLNALMHKRLGPALPMCLCSHHHHYKRPHSHSLSYQDYIQKQIPFSHTVPQTSAILSACQLSIHTDGCERRPSYSAGIVGCT